MSLSRDRVTKTCKLLVVDDDKTILRLFAAALVVFDGDHRDDGGYQGPGRRQSGMSYERHNGWVSATGRSGFTLVDLMIAVTVMGLIAFMAMPAIVKKMPERRLEGAVSAVVAQLRTAREQARSESRAVVVEIDARARCVTLKSDRNGNNVYETDETTALDLQSFTGVEIFANATNGVFHARGEFHCNASSLKIVLKAGNAGERFVYVFPGGHVESSRDSLF